MHTHADSRVENDGCAENRRCKRKTKNRALNNLASCTHATYHMRGIYMHNKYVERVSGRICVFASVFQLVSSNTITLQFTKYTQANNVNQKKTIPHTLTLTSQRETRALRRRVSTQAAFSDSQTTIHSRRELYIQISAQYHPFRLCELSGRAADY